MTRLTDGRTILAIDPGTEKSGFAVYDGVNLLEHGVVPNAEMLARLKGMPIGSAAGVHLAIEMIAGMGMPVGQEVFETCVWIGRFKQAWPWPDRVMHVYRQEVKLHLCGVSRAKDANVRQALLDRFARLGGGAVPQVGTKARPGPLFGVGTHVWPALGVAVTVAWKLQQAPAPKGRRARLA